MHMCVAATLHAAPSKSKGANIAVDTTPYWFNLLLFFLQKQTNTHAGVNRRAGKHSKEAVTSTSQTNTSAASDNTRADRQRINTWTDGGVERRKAVPGWRRICHWTVLSALVNVGRHHVTAERPASVAPRAAPEKHWDSASALLWGGDQQGGRGGRLGRDLPPLNYMLSPDLSSDLEITPAAFGWRPPLSLPPTSHLQPWEVTRSSVRLSVRKAYLCLQTWMFSESAAALCERNVSTTLDVLTLHQ